MTFLYNLKSTPSGFAMAKLDSDFNIAAVYNLAPSRNGHYSCDCPANARTVITKPCKHRRMLPLMLGAVNTDRFYDPESGSWCQPLGDLDRPQAQPDPILETIDPSWGEDGSGPVECEALAQVVTNTDEIACEAALSPTKQHTISGSDAADDDDIIEQPVSVPNASITQAQSSDVEQPRHHSPTLSAPTIRRR